MAFTWEKVGPREDERVLAGKVAGVLWLSVLPMLIVGMLLPGTVSDHTREVILISLPAALWGIACLTLIPWSRVSSPLVFHVPSVIALPYIAVLVALSGVTRSPFTLTTLMLLAFCAYFFPPRAATAYIGGCLVVQALPLVYDANALDVGLLAEVWVAIFVYAAVGGVIMVGKRQLLTLRDAAHELSLRDSLTGLFNRRALTDLLDGRRGGGRRGDAIGLLLIDLDDFKEANTLHGLPGGDGVLCAVADALRGLSRTEDMVVRLGGDEFAIVALGMDERAMRNLADRALEAVRRTGARLALPGFKLTASAGWAIYPDDPDSVDELMTVADVALRGAKINGKDRSQSPLDWSPELAL